MKNAPTEALWTRPFTLTMIGILFLFIPFALYLPVLPVYLLEELHSSLQEAGAINGIFLAAAVLFRAQTARLESRFGVRRVLLVSGFLFMITNLLYLAVSTVLGVMLIRFLSGVCFAVANTCFYAMGSRLISTARKGEGLAYLTTMVLAGGAIGPYIGLKLTYAYGYPSVFIFSALISLLGLLIATAIAIPEDTETVASRFTFHGLYEVKAIPASLIVFVIAIAYGGVITFVAVYATELRLQYVVEYFFVAMACASVITRLASGRIYDRFGPDYAIYPAIILMALGLLLLGIFPATAGMLAAAVIIGVGYGMTVPSIQALAIQRSPSQRSSAVTATFFSCLDGGIGLGAYILGGGIHVFGYAAVYQALGVLTFCCIVPYYVLYGRKREVT
ncbi:MAG: MFS transporter [Desulfuromonadaceae bacterium]|nr:MFS transporter [Desulfuromonadaceae bacterium]